MAESDIVTVQPDGSEEEDVGPKEEEDGGGGCAIPNSNQIPSQSKMPYPAKQLQKKYFADIERERAELKAVQDAKEKEDVDALLAALEACPELSDNEPVDAIGMDCEMVGVGENQQKQIVARVSLVNYKEETIYDTFVAPTEKVTFYRTFVSGITAKDLEGAPSFTTVQAKVKELIKGRILVGHALHHDLLVMGLSPENDGLVRDTSRFFGHWNIKKGLKYLSQTFLKKTIQEGSHDSEMDAKVPILLYKKFRKMWEVNPLTWGQVGGNKTEKNKNNSWRDKRGEREGSTMKRGEREGSTMKREANAKEEEAGVEVNTSTEAGVEVNTSTGSSTSTARRDTESSGRSVLVTEMPPIVGLACYPVEAEKGDRRIVIFNSMGQTDYSASIKIPEYKNKVQQPPSKETQEVINYLKESLRGKLIVGHMLHEFFQPLNFRHPNYLVRDTAVYFSSAGNKSPALPPLIRKHLLPEYESEKEKVDFLGFAPLLLYQKLKADWEQRTNTWGIKGNNGRTKDLIQKGEAQIAKNKAFREEMYATGKWTRREKDSGRRDGVAGRDEGGQGPRRKGDGGKRPRRKEVGGRGPRRKEEGGKGGE